MLKILNADKQPTKHQSLTHHTAGPMYSLFFSSFCFIGKQLFAMYPVSPPLLSANTGSTDMDLDIQMILST